MISRARLLSPLVALLIGLFATAAVAVLASRGEEARSEARFEGIADGTVAAIESRMLAQLTLLRGAAGLFNASETITEADFRAYVARLRLERFYPGVLGIGFTAYLPDRASADRFVSAVRREGDPGFRVWPDGTRAGYSAIRYLEPLNRRNREAIGFDMMSEPTRRAAMAAARASGFGVMTGRVRLVQEIDPVKQPGFLIYVPLYRGQRAGIPDKVAPGELYGWVYSPLRAHDLFGAIFSDHGLNQVVVEVFDAARREDRLLYRSGEVAATPRHVSERTLDVAGRSWIVRVTSAPGFDEGPGQAWIMTIVLAGVLVSMLIAGLVLQQARAAARTESEVKLRTRELRHANERLIEEARAREAAEGMVRQMQKVEAIGQLTGGIAHDFNNMLSIILGNLDIAERRVDDRDRLRRALENARAGAEKAADLTRRLLAFGRQQALAPRVLDPNKLVAGMSEMLRRTLGEAIRLETVLAGGIWRVCADAGQLENAILNLAINARDAMPDGGALTIETANCHLDEAYARTHEGVTPGQYVLIAVSDTGHGMTREVLEKALDPFFTTKEVGRGTGLGLSQVYGYTKQSGGHLKLYSEPGEGTTVKIYLPRHRGADEEAQVATDENAELPRGNGETILVVEDEAQVRAVSVEALRELGYRVIEAASGGEALGKFDADPAISLLFTDVVMPGMNGRQLADAVRARRPALKVVFTTGYTRNAIVHHGRLDEGVSLLQKPFTVTQLARKIREGLDR